jgi:hypothetical protein
MMGSDHAHAVINTRKGNRIMKIGRLAVAWSAAAIIVTGWTNPAWSAGKGVPRKLAGTSQLELAGSNLRCTDSYDITATDAAWGNPADWSALRVPGPTDVACIPSAYSGPSVVIAGRPYQVGALDALNPTGVHVNNWGLTIMDKKLASEATNFSVSIIGSLTLSGGKFKLLSGVSTLYDPIYGPGKLTITRKATVLGIQDGEFGGGLSVINKGQIQSGTTTAPGSVALCQDTAAQPATLLNEGTITIYAHGGVGGCNGETNQGTIVNETNGKIFATYPAGFTSTATINAIPTTNDGLIEVPQGMTLGVPASLINDGTIANGGILTFSAGNPTLGSSSTVGLVLSSSTSYGYFEEGVGSINLGGALAISTASGFTPATTDPPFVIGYDGYYTGTFVGNFSSFSVNGHPGLCIPDHPGLGFVQSFGPSGLWNDVMTLTVKSGMAGC